MTTRYYQHTTCWHYKVIVVMAQPDFVEFWLASRLVMACSVSLSIYYVFIK